MGPDRPRALRASTWWLLAGALVAVLVRWHGRHEGLIYPDGYQYLMMAKGIATHLTPTLAARAGGDAFAPSADAALKPLFPMLVAAASAVTDLPTAAQVVTAMSAGAAVVALAALTWTVSGSQFAAAAAGVGALLNPTLTLWSGFSGPDPLAEALGLACALAVARRHARAAGVLGALCAASRPEWGLALIAAGLAALTARSWRRTAGPALLTACFTLAAIIGVVRPPLTVPHGGAAAILSALAGSIVIGVLARRASSTLAGRYAAVLVAAASVAGVAITGHSAALSALLRANGPLVGLAFAGAIAACRRTGAAVPVILATLALPFAAYEYRNPSSARYLTEFIPALCLLGALGLPALTDALSAGLHGPLAVVRRARLSPRRGALAVTGAALMVAPLLVSSTPLVVGRDYFQTLAVWLRHAPPGPIVSAAPDAFSVLLPGRAERALAPGATGLILLDASQREYAATTVAIGRTLAAWSPPRGFARADGTLDAGAARLIAGTVIR